jgi:hypothetical protein
VLLGLRAPTAGSMVGFWKARDEPESLRLVSRANSVRSNEPLTLRNPS